MRSANIHIFDVVIIVAYLIGIVFAGVWVSRKQKNTSSDYFLAGHSLHWSVIGFALFATNISTVHLVGLASSGYKDGLVIGNFEWLAITCLVLLSLVFSPFYFHNGVTTLPEYLERRFSSGCRTFLAIMAVVAALFIHIGVSLYAGSAIIEQLFGLNTQLSILLISLATVVYTVAGGLRSVVVTEVFQTFILIGGAVALTVLSFVALSGHGIHDLASLTSAVKPRQMSMIHTDGNYPFYALALGYPVLGIWYWCADQTIVQRVLGARTLRDAQIGPLFAGLIKILPVFVMVLPGVIAYVLFPEYIGDNPDQALPVLIDRLVPSGIEGFGLKGLIIAGLLSALMSTVSSALNSTSTLVSIDIYQRLRPDASDRMLVFIGRITACIVMALAMLWSTQGSRFGGIFAGLNQMIACLAPPITTVFVWGAFWRRGTQQAALTTLIAGFVAGIATFVLDFPAMGYEIITKRLGIPFMMQAWLLFCLCSLIFVVISLLTPPPTKQQIDGLCWSSPLAPLRLGKIAGVTDVRILAAVLIGVLVLLYWRFA